MGLDTIIRSAVALAHGITKPVQVSVQHEAWIGQTGDGTPEYDDPVPRLALVERKQRRFTTDRGQEVVSEHRLLILEPVLPNGADERREPIDERDRFTLPDGTTAPIVGIGGLLDAGTPIPFVNGDGFTEDGVSTTYSHEIYLGRGTRS